ncbi:hypothetical protein Pmani_027981 [Petrolisthes manimaculis]|uniref:Testis-expressed sequence 264 protein n=1 Tax=Petrolisthes manimaculis TaxID=1843537 RepID=A0AAE1P1W9_9EUCA|nr:hypothetical protein Pmani_027981 [Petrolisthes manimaculis]
METETALLWGFVVLLLVVFITIIGLLVHSGIFEPVEVRTCKPDIGEVYIAYQFARGPYKESGALFTQIHTLLPDYRTVGVYYDNPKMKQPQKLRYIVGIILAENGSRVDPDHRKLLEENGYRFATFPAIDHAVQASFPYKSTISIVVAIMKVYPALREYVETRSLCAWPFLEVYDCKSGKIIFIGPLAQQDDFCVPEVQPNEDNDEENDFDDDRTEASGYSWNESGSFVRGDSECSDSGAEENLSHPPPPPPPEQPPSYPANTTTTINPSTLSAIPCPSATSDIPPIQPPLPSPPISLLKGDDLDNPTPTPAPEAVNLMPPPPTPPAHIPSFSAPDTPPALAPLLDTTPVLAPVPATPPSHAPVPATPPSHAPVPVTPPPHAPLPIPTTPVLTPATTEPVDVSDSGSQGGEESDANTGSSFEEIDEREAAVAAAAAMSNRAGNSSEGDEAGEKKEDDEGER